MEQLRSLCMHIRPEAYVDEKKSASTDFIKDIESQLGRPLDLTEKMELGADLDLDEQDVDTIERV